MLLCNEAGGITISNVLFDRFRVPARVVWQLFTNDCPKTDPNPELKPTSEVSWAPDIRTLELFYL